MQLLHDFRSFAPPLDPRAIADRVAREIGKQRRSLGLELAAAAVIVGFYGWMLVRGATLPVIVLALGSCVFTGAWVTSLVTMLPSPPTTSATTAQHVAWLRARKTGELRFATFARKVTVGLAAFVLALMPLMIQRGWAGYAREPWRAFVGFGVAFAISGAVYVLQQRKERNVRAELAELERLAE